MSIQPDAPSKPSGMYIVVAVLVLLAGVGIFGYMMYSVAGAAKTGMGMTTIAVPGTKTVSLTEPGMYIVFHQHGGMSGGTVQTAAPDISGLTVTITSPGGEEVPMAPFQGQANTQIGNIKQEAIGQFEAAQPGDYIIKATYPEGEEGPQTTLALITMSAALKAAGSMFGGMAVCCVSVVIALVLVIVFFVKRSKASRTAAMYAPPGMTPPGGAPPAP